MYPLLINNAEGVHTRSAAYATNAEIVGNPTLDHQRCMPDSWPLIWRYGYIFGSVSTMKCYRGIFFEDISLICDVVEIILSLIALKMVKYNFWILSKIACLTTIEGFDIPTRTRPWSSTALGT